MISQFIFQTMFPVVVGVDSVVVLLTPLTYGKSAALLISKASRSFIKVQLVKFLLVVHEKYLLRIDSANCANCAKL